MFYLNTLQSNFRKKNDWTNQNGGGSDGGGANGYIWAWLFVIADD